VPDWLSTALEDADGQDDADGEGMPVQLRQSGAVPTTSPTPARRPMDCRPLVHLDIRRSHRGGLRAVAESRPQGHHRPGAMRESEW